MSNHNAILEIVERAALLAENDDTPALVVALAHMVMNGAADGSPQVLALQQQVAALQAQLAEAKVDVPTVTGPHTLHVYFGDSP